MTVKDFLAIQKFEEVFQKYMELYPITELEQLEFRHHHEIEDINMLVTKKKTAYERVWNDLLDTKINRDSTSILVANKYLDTDLDGEIAELVSSSVYNYSDILTIGILDSFYDDKAQEIEGYSYLFIEWEDVLGYTFACSTLMLVQPEEVAAGLLHELTMMGLTREQVSKNIKKEMAILLKSTEEINNPERLHSGKDIDEFFDELFNETPEEKVKRKKELEDYTLRCQANLPEIMDFNEKQKNKLWKALYEEFKKS